MSDFSADRVLIIPGVSSRKEFSDSFSDFSLNANNAQNGGIVSDQEIQVDPNSIKPPCEPSKGDYKTSAEYASAVEGWKLIRSARLRRSGCLACQIQSHGISSLTPSTCPVDLCDLGIDTKNSASVATAKCPLEV